MDGVVVVTQYRAAVSRDAVRFEEVEGDDAQLAGDTRESGIG